MKYVVGDITYFAFSDFKNETQLQAITQRKPFLNWREGLDIPVIVTLSRDDLTCDEI